MGECPQPVLSSIAAGLKIELESPETEGGEGGGVQSDGSTPSYILLMTHASRWESRSSQLLGSDRSTFKPNQPSESSDALPVPKRALF